MSDSKCPFCKCDVWKGETHKMTCPTGKDLENTSSEELGAAADLFDSLIDGRYEKQEFVICSDSSR